MKPTYFVRRKESPDPKHETLEAAQAKAEKMAEGEPGQVFEILKCVGYASTSKASTFWMDGEGPPGKPRYRELEEGETFQAGDEYRHPGEPWRTVPPNSFGKKLGGYFLNIKHRRPL